MNVTIRYFAAAAEATGRDEELLSLGDEATLGDLKAELEQRYGAAMRQVLRNGSFLMDRVVRRDLAHPLTESVDVLPPFAGG